MSERVIAYIDGYNLYFGIREKGWKQLYWLDLPKLIQNLLRDNQQLVDTKYFTARISGPAGKQKRQTAFIEALEARGELKIIYGQYRSEPRECRNCNTVTHHPNEKMTDVNIAVELLEDAFHNRFDTAFLISGDSDQTPPIRAIRRLFPEKRVVACFPPARFSEELKNAANASIHLGRALLAKSLLPPQVAKSDGFILECPEPWRERQPDKSIEVINR